MTFLKVLLLIVEIISSFLLILVILAQKSKDQGLGMAFGSGMGESLFGSRAGNVLTRITVILGIVFMVTTLGLGLIYSHSGPRSGSSLLDDVQETTQTPPAGEGEQGEPVSMAFTPEDAEAPAGDLQAPEIVVIPDETAAPAGEEAPAETPAEEPAAVEEAVAEETAPVETPAEEPVAAEEVPAAVEEAVAEEAAPAEAVVEEAASEAPAEAEKPAKKPRRRSKKAAAKPAAEEAPATEEAPAAEEAPAEEPAAEEAPAA